MTRVVNRWCIATGAFILMISGFFPKPPSGRFLRASAQHGLLGLFNVRRVLHGEKDVGDASSMGR